MLQRAAVIQPQADNARHTVGTAVMHRAVVDHVGQAPAVARTVLLHTDHTADPGVFYVLVVVVLGVVIARGAILRAVEAAHGGAVEQVGHILVGLVLTDHTANYGIVHVAVVAIDKPFSGGGFAYNAGIGVVAGNAAQVARGFLCSAGGAAAQGNRQLVFGKTCRVHGSVTARAVTHGIHTAQVGKGFVVRCDLARVVRSNAVLQLGDHCVNAGFAAAKPNLDFVDCILCTLTAAAGDFARVRPGNAAHKAVFGNDGAAFFRADGAVLNCAFAAVAPDNTAHMAGIVQLGCNVLAGLHVGDAQHIDVYLPHGAARNGGVVYARHTADGIAHLGCAHRGMGVIGNGFPQLPRRKDTVLQGAVVYARNAAQGAIFFKFLGHVQRDLYLIYNSVFFVLPCRAAKGDVCGGQTAEGQGVLLHGASGCFGADDGSVVHARNAADYGSTALQGGFLYGNALNGAVVDSRHSAHIGRAAVDGAAIHYLHGADAAAVERRHAARIAVFTADFCAYGGGALHIARVLPGNAARVVRCGVNRTGIVTRRYNAVLRIAAHGGACVLVGAHGEGRRCCAAFHAAAVIACQPADSLAALHAAALYGDILHGTAVLPHSAARVAAAGCHVDGLQGAALHRALVCARHTADSFAALHGDDAIGDILHRAALRVKTCHAADSLLTADGDIVGCAGLDDARVDARNAADVLVARLARA